MKICIDKTHVNIKSPKKCMKDAIIFGIVYAYFNLQLTSSEKVLGIHMLDDYLTWTYFFNMFQKISSYLWFLLQIKSYLSLV